MEPKRSSDIDLWTLAIAAVASAVAAYVTSQFWAGGTLVSAALTPVIVALVKEALNRPVERVSTLRAKREAESKRRWKVALVSAAAAFVLVVAVFTVPELVTGSSIGRGGDHATTFFGGKERKSTRRKHRSKTAPDATATPTASPKETATPVPTETPAETPSPTPSPTATAPSVPTVAPTP
ncbi:MAG: hypothetical protein QOI80_2801 [Solirubrobacteraceae bacterium]|nr:hypothetical protein [Solirubrobacteraceae bacterium]